MTCDLAGVRLDRPEPGWLVPSSTCLISLLRIVSMSTIALRSSTFGWST